MNVHEHQAKAILKEYGAPVANGVAVTDIAQAEAAVAALSGPVCSRPRRSTRATEPPPAPISPWGRRSG